MYVVTHLAYYTNHYRRKGKDDGWYFLFGYPAYWAYPTLEEAYQYVSDWEEAMVNREARRKEHGASLSPITREFYINEQPVYVFEGADGIWAESRSTLTNKTQ